MDPEGEGRDHRHQGSRLDANPLLSPAIWDDQLRRRVSSPEVAETGYAAFTSRKGQAITARLIVRRVKDRAARLVPA